MPAPMRLAVNTQTPLLRFVDGSPCPTTGGVVRMLVPLLRRWRASGALHGAEWIAMGGEANDRRLAHDGLSLTFVGLAEDERRGYAVVKERLWKLLHTSPATPAWADAPPPASAWRAFEAYQDRSARALLDAAGRLGGVDLLYVHDFQQIGVARAWRGPPVPRVFHLHTPFPSVLPRRWTDYVVGELRRYDAVVVSTARYAENLRAAGLDRPVHVVRPFIDPESYPRVSRAEAAAFRERLGIAADDAMILHVGRMDPMKGQDRLLRALPAILREVPQAKLVLVGNGSFSSSRRGGLGLGKGSAWRARLEALARTLGIESRVVLTGHLDDTALAAAYARCDVFVLPSTREGFGLVAIEAWRHAKPVIVSDRAGVAEIVEDGVSGRVVDCADPRRLARAIVDTLRDPAAAAMGPAGRAASEAATIGVGGTRLERLFAEVLHVPARAPA